MKNNLNNSPSTSSTSTMPTPMTLKTYNEIIKTIDLNSHKMSNCLSVLEDKFYMVSTFTLGSILSNFVQKKMKANHGRHSSSKKVEEYYQRFYKAIESKEKSGILLRLSDEIGISPVLVARFLLEYYILNVQEKEKESKESEINQNNIDKSIEGNSNINSLYKIKTEINRYLADTSQIPDKNLAYEVYLCTVQDQHYGPIPDSIKHMIGIEYENILKDKLIELKILFNDENQLRNKGFDKTPDFKLEIPIAIEGKVVNWIESKATFGDEETHNSYLNDQLTSYWNRFGPGMIIYWFGFLETLPSITQIGVLINDHLPNKVTFMDPMKITVIPDSIASLDESLSKEKLSNIEKNANEQPIN